MTARPSQQPLKCAEILLVAIMLPRIKKCAAVSELRIAASECCLCACRCTHICAFKITYMYASKFISPVFPDQQLTVIENLFIG